ncbi:hypothetical protein CK203_023805 [Vitis vinifera]|uniref:Uncharacterized protein n=1 Tax=Vitis vinifera TaxID=29760 RepID=A0A438JA20_VITVI|nr:hypothetical protein CK203_023805 [Vitis vinifera]
MGRETWRCTFKEPEQQKTNGQSVKLEVKGRWMPEEEGQSAKLEVKVRDGSKRRKTQDFADEADSTAADTGNSGIAESQATDSKAEPVELNAETRKSHYPKLGFPEGSVSRGGLVSSGGA